MSLIEENEDNSVSLESSPQKSKETRFTVDAKQHQTTVFQSSHVMKQIQLSSKSRTFLIIRILLICLCCIYIPMGSIFQSKLEEIERQRIVSSITNVVSSKIKASSWYYYINQGLIELISGKEIIILYTSLIYLFHPFIALKLVFVINLLYYCIAILQCVYQYRRPFWFEVPNEQIVNPFCITSYSSPNDNLFFVTFIYLYGIVSIRLVNKKEKLSTINKALVWLPYFVLIIAISFILIINKINFIYQLAFSWAISLMLTCGLMDMDNKIHNFIFRSLKNIYKTRKYKMKIFFYVLSLTLLSVLIFLQLSFDNLNTVEDNLLQNTHCAYISIEEMGIKKTYLNVSYVFGIIGAFWGASLTVERDCGKWWIGTKCNSIIKIAITLLFCSIYSYVFSFVGIITYELRFLILCVKNFVQYYFVMGILPIIFDNFKMNEKIEITRNKIDTIFTKTIFADSKVMPLMKENDPISNLSMFQNENENEENKADSYFETNKQDQSDIDNEDNVDLLNKQKEEKIFKKSTIVTNLKKHSGEERYEFTIKDEHQKDQLYLAFNKDFVEEEEPSENSEH